MNDGLRLLTGSALFAFLALHCTKLEDATDRFNALSSSGGAGVGATGGSASESSGVPGLVAGAEAGGASAGKAGASTNGQGGAGGKSGAHAGVGGTSDAGNAGETEQGGAGDGGDTGVGGSSGADCTDETGFDGLGCYSCEPTDIVTLEQACTDASCKLFDNQARLTLLESDGSLPELPAASGGGGAGASGAGGGGAGAGASAGGAGAGGADGGMGGVEAAGAGGAVAGGAGAAGSAGASGVACSALAGSGTVVYVTGSSASKPFLQQIAQQLSGGGVYLVYTSTGSCIGVDAIVNGTPMKTGPAPAPATSATYWESSSSTGKACDLPAAGVAADIGISDVFAPTCPGFELTDLDAQDIRDAHGPIQTMTFAVPTNSPFSEISAQAAYFVFGFGVGGGVSDGSGNPIWYDEGYIYQRSATSGTQAMLASAIGVAPARWKGKQHKTSDDVSTDLQSAASTEETAKKAIGILAADYIDTKNLRAQIKMLAFQDSRQPCAVFPDSTATAHDKRNVRDGHYPIWSPLHLLYKTDQAGNPVNEENRQQVTDIIGYLSGTKPLPNGVKLLDVYAQSGLVPECAMRVTRSADGGNITPRKPSSPCSCLFELKATGATSCTPCAVQGDCAAGETCSQGFCEG